MERVQENDNQLK